MQGPSRSCNRRHIGLGPTRLWDRKGSKWLGEDGKIAGRESSCRKQHVQAKCTWGTQWQLVRARGPRRWGAGPWWWLGCSRDQLLRCWRLGEDKVQRTQVTGLWGLLTNWETPFCGLEQWLGSALRPMPRPVHHQASSIAGTIDTFDRYMSIQ